MLHEHAAIKKMDCTVLDCFTALAGNSEECRIDAGVRLLEHVFGKQVKFKVRAYDLNREHIIVYLKYLPDEFLTSPLIENISLLTREFYVIG
jgi:hypothetical protein